MFAPAFAPDSRRGARGCACRVRRGRRIEEWSSAQLELDLAAALALDECGACAARTNGPCRACCARAGKVYAQVQAGASLALAASVLGLTTRLAGELLEEERDRRGLKATAVPMVPNRVLRERFEELRSGDGSVSARSVARACGWASASDVLRRLGLARTSDRHIGERVYEGRVLTQITPEAAGKLARALGMAPVEVDRPTSVS